MALMVVVVQKRVSQMKKKRKNQQTKTTEGATEEASAFRVGEGWVAVHGRVERVLCRPVGTTRTALLWQRGIEDLLRAFQQVF